MKITAHMLVKNEETWIWFAIQAILPAVERLIIFDTGSTDSTLRIIRQLIKTNSEAKRKIFLNKRTADDRATLVKLRQEMVELTKTEWFLLVDGDEVWPKDSLQILIDQIQSTDKNSIGAVVRTRNCVGDVRHYQPESAGKYQLKGRMGHLTIRAYRKTPSYQWQGEYPLEGYMDTKGELLNNQDEKLLFVDTYYYHLTHLKRSNQSDSARVIDRLKKYKLEIGTKAKDEDLPEVFFLQRPNMIPDPFKGFSSQEKIIAQILTPFKKLKRILK